jgi:glycerol-3-phosphate dehydrogenase
MNSSALNAARRTAEIDELAGGTEVDLLVIGGGVTGAGVALDAAARGLSVALLEKHDLAFGTSRWSSKLVHGGLRYLARGQVAIAHESAVERGILMTRTAPHLVRALPILVPVSGPRSAAAIVPAGLYAGDAMRIAARTPAAVLPRPQRLGRGAALALAPGLRAAGLRGAWLYHDGQLVDDARLVVALARTAAAHGARIITRAAVSAVDGRSAEVVDTLTGTPFTVRARAVVNATGVWASALAPEIRLRPSRGTHLVVPAAAVGSPRAALTVPVGGNRYALVLPQPGAGTAYIGLTDEPMSGPIPDVPTPSAEEIAYLLEAASSALERPLTPADVLSAYAGLRPLLDGGAGRTADLSRKHAVLTGPTGVVTVVGGKLTTYRRMAEDAVDAAIRHAALPWAPSGTRRLPLVGAAPRRVLADVEAPARLVARYGTEAPAVAAAGPGTPLAEGTAVTTAEALFALSHEGALTADDILDRRTRLGLTPVVRAAAAPAVAALTDGAAREA